MELSQEFIQSLVSIHHSPFANHNNVISYITDGQKWDKAVILSSLYLLAIAGDGYIYLHNEDPIKASALSYYDLCIWPNAKRFDLQKMKHNYHVKASSVVMTSA